MTNTVDNSTAEYYLFQELANQIKNSNDNNLRETYEEKRLVYLDDDPETLKEFISIIEGLSSKTLENAPNHIKGELKQLEDDEIRDLLKEHNITIYGRSGLKLNSKELKKYQKN